jgi:hypothetical protein
MSITATILPSRFWDNVHVEPNTGCWLWAGRTNGRGYGHFWLNGDRVYAHRLAYATLVGSLPDGLQVDHVCHTRQCVNPEHLRLATNRENQHNRKSQASSSPYKGVSWSKRDGKWVARIMLDYQRFLGSFVDAVDAAYAYDFAAMEHFGVFAATNQALGLIPTVSAERLAMYASVERTPSSRFRGVAWCKRSAKWKASLTVRGRRRHLGYFADEADAARAYDRATSEEEGL